MTTADDIHALFQQIDHTAWGAEERELTARAVAMAVELGDEELEYRARMRQTSSANQGGDTTLLLSSFAWCLAKHDADPTRFPSDIGNGGADLMWHFKWMASTLRASPEFSTEQIQAVLDDMEAHFRAEGLGLSAVAMARFEDAWGSGRLAEAEERRLVLEATPRDDHSHCDACGRSQLVGYFADTDRDADAIRLVEEMLEGGFGCGEEPEHALARSLLPFLRAGRFADAKRAHLRSYRLARDNADNLGMVATNIVFAAITGNEARALAMVERHVRWLAHDALNVAGHARALRSFGIALDAVTRSGHGSSVVRGADAHELVRFFGEHDGPWTAAELAPVAWAKAAEIGARFDARNGTTAFADVWARDRRVAELRFDVPILSEAFTPEPAAVVPQTAAERFTRAIELSDWGDAAGALIALQAALDDNDPKHAADLHGLMVGALLASDRQDDTSPHLVAYAAASRADGHDELADLIEDLGLTLFGVEGEESVARMLQAAEAAVSPGVRAVTLSGVASAYLRDGKVQEALDMAKLSHEAFVMHGDREDIVDALANVAFYAGIAGDTAAARAAADAGLEMPEASQGQRASMLEIRGRIRGGEGEFVDGAADADEASRLIALIGATWGAARVSVLAGAMYEDAGMPSEAAARYRVTLRQVERDGDDTSAVRFRLARALLSAGNAGEAAELLSAVHEEEAAAEASAASRAETVALLAEAFEVDEQYGNAVGAWGYAADLFEQAESVAGRAHALSMQGRILGQFGETEESVALLEQAIELARQEPDNVVLLSRSLHLLAQTLGAVGDERALSVLDETERLAVEHDAPWLLADVTDSRARALGAMGRLDDAIAAALRAADGYDQEGDAQSAGGAELYAARVLAGSDRLDEAISIYRTLLARPIMGTPVHQVGALELGNLLTTLGRHGEAAEVRAALDE